MGFQIDPFQFVRFKENFETDSILEYPI
jgi:hypothetical protein